MCSLGVSAAHIEEGKFSGASRGMMRAVYKIGKKHKAWQPTQPLRREVERERQGRPGPEHPLPCSIQLHSLPLAQDSHVGAPELGGGGVFCERTIGDGVPCGQRPHGSRD